MNVRIHLTGTDGYFHLFCFKVDDMMKDILIRSNFFSPKLRTKYMNIFFDPQASTAALSLSLSLLLCACALLPLSVGARQAKFLFRSTTTITTTATVSTSTNCYTTTAAITTACTGRRKKRAIVESR